MPYTKERSKEEINKLIEKYERVKAEGKIKRYNEETTKKDFILPLFEALGWDVYNKKADEVTAEEKASKGRVDYAFRLNGISKLFVEAKALKVDLDQPKWAQQAINYAWYKSVVWAILTDFEGIKVFNAEVKSTYPLQSMLFSLSYRQYLERFDQLWLLSRESLEQGLLDKEAEKWGKKLRKVPVDKQLLDDFTRWRELLSKDILKLNSNKHLTEEELDESVQRILDRLIFIRSCEDRELEPKVLISDLREWVDKGRGALVKKVRERFVYFDDRYDSELFKNHLCDDLKINNEVLKDIIRGLYRTKDMGIPYDFSAIDADVLGTIYEQYLGHLLKKTPKRAKLEAKKAHRKEQGIYYTPTYIVDYIVRNTLGELLKDKNVDAENIKILDPACGSGSFLIKSFDVLNEYWAKKNRYDQTELDIETGASTPFTRKVKILKNNIFGVDLDPRAVEIAQLNLLLKTAEKKQRLPLLHKNIKCGNSIIDDEKIAGKRAFNWQDEFLDVMDNGGFNVVVGNPPYGAELSAEERKFISNKYPSAGSYKNSALIFIELAYKLVKEGGFVGLIVPKSLAYSQKWGPCRELIKNDLIKIVDVSKAFEEVLLEQVIIVLRKGSNQKSYSIDIIGSTIQDSVVVAKKYIDLIDSIIVHNDARDLRVFKSVNKGNPYMKDISKTSRGMPYQRYVTKNKTKYQTYRGKNIARYLLRESDDFLPFDKIDMNNSKIKFLLQPKIISQRIVAHVTKPKDHIIIMSTTDKKGVLTLDTIENTVIEDESYPLELITSLFNSRLISWYAYRYVFAKAIRTMDFDNYYVGKIPIPKKIRNLSDFIRLCNRMLELNKSLEELKDKRTDERCKIEDEIKNTDAEIDKLVYGLYGLTEEEIKVVESE